MAYVDENGLILIDDVEVASDVSKLQAGLNSLNEALEILNNMANINSSFEGCTATAIESSIVDLIKQIESQKEQIEKIIMYIKAVAERYKVIDAKMRDYIKNSPQDWSKS